MRKFFFLLLTFTLFVKADYIDNDLDGVDDRVDKCPNTPFTEIVDKDGCSASQLKKSFTIDFYTEYSWIKDESFKDESLFVYTSLYKKPYLFAISGSINGFKSSTPTLSRLNLKSKRYFFISANFYTSLGVGSSLPINFKGKKTTFTTYGSLNYSWHDISLFGGGSYTLTQQNHNEKSLYSGISYDGSKWSISTTYLWSKDRYDGISQSIGYGFYYFFKTFYIALNYTKGLNSYATDQSLSLGVGKSF